MPPTAVSRSSAARTAERSVEGAARCSAKSENVTRPSRNVSGSSSVSRLAELTAAVMRFGSTSVAFIEPEMSVTIITVAARSGDGDRALRAGEGDDHRGQREHQQQRRQVAAQARAAR